MVYFLIITKYGRIEAFGSACRDRVLPCESAKFHSQSQEEVISWNGN